MPGYTQRRYHLNSSGNLFLASRCTRVPEKPVATTVTASRSNSLREAPPIQDETSGFCSAWRLRSCGGRNGCRRSKALKSKLEYPFGSTHEETSQVDYLCHLKRPPHPFVSIPTQTPTCLQQFQRMPQPHTPLPYSHLIHLLRPSYLGIVFRTPIQPIEQIRAPCFAPPARPNKPSKQLPCIDEVREMIPTCSVCFERLYIVGRAFSASNEGWVEFSDAKA